MFFSLFKKLISNLFFIKSTKIIMTTTYLELRSDMLTLDPIKDMPVCLLVKLVSQYYALFKKMRDIDPVGSKCDIEHFIDILVDLLNDRIEKWSYDEESLVGFYENFVREIFVPMCPDYSDTVQHSSLLKDRAFGIICRSCEGELTVKNMIDKLNLLKRIGIFNKKSLDCVFAIIIENQTFDYVKSNLGQINRLISIFKECVALNVNLSRILRFLVIQQLNSDPDTNYIRHLLYLKTGEMIITNYIQTKPSFQAILRGIPENAELTPLDKYYVCYEKKHGPWNFISPHFIE